MAHYFLVAFLILFGLTLLGLSLIPAWVTGACAVVAGVLMLVGK